MFISFASEREGYLEKEGGGGGGGGVLQKRGLPTLEETMPYDF